jgi:hypothetical protein
LEGGGQIVLEFTYIDAIKQIGAGGSTKSAA